MKKYLPVVLLFFIFCAAAMGQALVPPDYGMLLNLNFETEGNVDTDKIGYIRTETLTPWFSYAPSGQFSLYLSLDFSLEHSESINGDDGPLWEPLFQVNRFQASWRPLPFLFVEAGRVKYSDPLGSIASGLFDGATASLSLGTNSLSASALYAGLQHKERAKVVMTTGDLIDYVDEDTYFAASRLLFSLFWQSRYLFNFNSTLDFGGIAQVDLRTNNQEKLHSQYALLKFSFPVLSAVDISAGGIFGVKQQDTGSALSYTGNFSAALDVPGPLTDRVLLAGFISSGSVGGDLRPYFPVTVISAGEVFTPSIAGLYTAKVAYRIAPLRSLYVNVEGTYFWRTSRDIIPGTSATSNLDTNNLGAEFYLRTVWVPLSDLSFSLGWGMFFPDGPLKDAGVPVMWKTVIAATVSL
ncbi:MAG: hypothetical protein LBT39_01160 [Treponema sp.]|jgi:hypothetical protein|nr:hypothetical protein [Treponema sp.]